jgi:hypothetical protein
VEKAPLRRIHVRPAAHPCAARGIERAPTRPLPLTQSVALSCPRRHACDDWQATRTSWVDEEAASVGEDDSGERRAKACIACPRPGCACIAFAALPACCTMRTDPSLLDASTASWASERAVTQRACKRSTHTRPATRQCTCHAPKERGSPASPLLLPLFLRDLREVAGETFMFKPTAGAPESGTCGDPILEACAAADRAPAKAAKHSQASDAPADDETRCAQARTHSPTHSPTNTHAHTCTRSPTCGSCTLEIDASVWAVVCSHARRSPSSSTPEIEKEEDTSVETKTETSPAKDLRREGGREGGRGRRRGPAALQGGACKGPGLAGEGGDGNGEEGQGKIGEEEGTGAPGEQGFGQKRALTGVNFLFIYIL